MDQALFVRWVNASRVMERIPAPLGGHLMVRIQGAGRLDCQLRERDAWYGDLEARQQNPEVNPDLSDYLHLSLLWVLDVFEVVRTIESIFRRLKVDLGPDGQKALRDLKTHLAQIRTPLAKFQAPGRPRVPLVGYPVLVADVGSGWEVGEEGVVIVSRQRLADELLAFLEAAAGA